MNKRIEVFLEGICKKNGYEKWKDDNELLDLLRDYNALYEERISEHRWWNTFWYVIKMEDKYIGYVYAETTGDMSPREAGWEFDPDSICEMKPQIKTIVTYVKKD